MICKFAYVKPKCQNVNIKNIKGTNIAYVKPHIITINEIDYLMFDECDEFNKNNFDEIIDVYLSIAKVNFNDFWAIYDDLRFIFKNK